jgi:beta-phosphoglucomutase-like phosphatase (HAD superfamily)
MKYKVILFDLDGVLVDTVDIQIISTLQALSEEIDEEINEREDIVSIIKKTITTSEKLNIIKNQLKLNINIDRVYNRKKIIANQLFNNFKIDDDKIEMFKYLKNKKIKIGVITNSNRKSAELLLKKTGIFDMIDILISNSDTENKKPHAEPYIRGMLHFNKNIEEYLIIEDSDDGIQSAINSGCDYIRVSNSKEVSIELIKKHID